MEKRVRGSTVERVSIWLLAVLVTMVFSACTQGAGADIPTANDGGGGATADTPTASDNQGANATPTPVNEEDATLLYAQCIRDNGYPEFPDPIPGRGIMLRRDQGMSFNDPRMLAAMEACQDLRPPGMGGGATIGAGLGGQAFAQDEEARLAFAQCMRENGVPNFPDPSAGGGAVVIAPDMGIDPNDPKFQTAVQTCISSLSEEADQ